MTETSQLATGIMSRVCIVPFLIIACSDAPAPSTYPVPGQTRVLGGFVGHDARMHPRNLQPARLAFYGTDLGWSYEHGNKIQFLFGDSSASEHGDPVDAVHDDAFGSIELADWPDPGVFDADTIPTIEIGQIPGTERVAGLDPGHPMDELKTPLGGFSNGSHEFAVFITAKPQGCRVDADCSNGLSCDTGLGYFEEAYDQPSGVTFPCDGAANHCTADTMRGVDGVPLENSGFCSDRTSSVWAHSGIGRISAYGMRHLVARRSRTEPWVYTPLHAWLTNKFMNVALRPVADFVPERGSGSANQDYRNIPRPGRNGRVLLWGRPGFIGVNAAGATLALYFGYLDMPGDAELDWMVRYYAGIGVDGHPRFSSNENEAIPLDLDSSRDEAQYEEPDDVVQQMTIVWVEHLDKWVMLYGGGISQHPIEGSLMNCGMLELFARSECENVVIGNGAIRMRTADDPWGPWTPPQDVVAGGNPWQRPPGDQYGPGGVLHHPDCIGDQCQERTPYMVPGDYGALYGANIIEEWIRPAESGVDIIWNASTWNPYRVILLRTRILVR